MKWVVLNVARTVGENVNLYMDGKVGLRGWGKNPLIRHIIQFARLVEAFMPGRSM